VNDILLIDLDGSARVSVLPILHAKGYYEDIGEYPCRIQASARSFDPNNLRLLLPLFNRSNGHPGKGLLLDFNLNQIFPIEPDASTVEDYAVTYLNSDLVWVGENEVSGWIFNVHDLLSGPAVVEGETLMTGASK